MIQTTTEKLFAPDPQQEVYHYLRNTFQIIIIKLFETPDTLTTQTIHKAISDFIQRIKETKPNELPQNIKTSLIEKFQPLLNVTNLPDLQKQFKDLYCQYDPDTCNRLKNLKPQRSLI